MYVAAKGGEKAINAAHCWLAEDARGDLANPEITQTQIEEQLGRAVDRVMAEGALYDPPMAAQAFRQAQGDVIEAAFLVRAYRATLPRLLDSEPVDTSGMLPQRRISAVFKDLPGGQRLGPTRDYSLRLLGVEHETSELSVVLGDLATTTSPGPLPRVSDVLGTECLLEPDGDPSETPEGDLTLLPLAFPAPRGVRLQALARGDEGFLLALGYSTQRGYGNNHPFVGELRVGTVAVRILPSELGFSIDIGEITLTECQMINQFVDTNKERPIFTRGYGLCFGRADRKAIAMALVDRAMRAEELGEDITAPAQDVEFVLSHCDNIEATGFVEHLKLPHHVDFQSELETLRALRADRGRDDGI
jgi:alpha-D-ribose 1-methylphosphonate 5-triphosphate synthase subunit PhnI